ncbi:MAG: TQO small subunit DoxD [Chthoniobacteraceae bacterium]
MIPKHSDSSSETGRASLLLGDILLPLRLVVGWTYFSAFWRRLVLENKLIPDAPGYIGEKFNHFLPNALVIKPVIEFFVSQPVLLWWQLAVFTAVEAVVGLALMAGFVTRLAGIATSLLAFGILLGAGWLGTTCLDEWQIGVLGITAGLVCAMAGGGRYSADRFLMRRFPSLTNTWWGKITFGSALQKPRLLSRLALAGGIAVFALTLATNQAFHGGVWGTLHNKSVRPKVEITDARLGPDGLNFTAQRVEGADVYGSFLVEARLLDGAGQEEVAWSAETLAKTPVTDIENRYVAKIKPGPHGLVLPLGAKATLLLRHEALRRLTTGPHTLELVDVSGAKWTAPVHGNTP